MNVINAFIISFIAGFSTLLGGLIIFFKTADDKINSFITFSLSFSISIMIGISITDLIPNAFFSVLYSYNYIGLFIIILSFLLGVFIIIFLNRLLSNNNSLYKVGILSMIALIIHNFPEGILTFIGTIKDTSLGLKIALSIILHNIPEGISIAIPIYYSTKSYNKALSKTLLSGLFEPLGAILTYLLLKDYITDLLLNITLLFVSGIMITLAINNILPNVIKYNNKKCIISGLLIGIIVIIINHFII